MSASAKSILAQAESKSMPGQLRSVDSTFEATASLTPELVIALCGPIGSPLHETADQVGNALNDFGYKTEPIRLSELIRLNSDNSGIEINLSSRYSEIHTLIKAGDELRFRYGNDVLAKLAIAKIGADRKKKYGDFSDRANESETDSKQRIRAHRICHVVDSIKNVSELKLLRSIYGEALFAVGVFSPLEVRQKNLERPGALTSEDIKKLIDTDSGEEFSHGQSVRETFPQCDFFLRVDESISGPSEPQAIGQLVGKLRRLFNLIFRTAVVSPSSEENAMYAAASAARNSACISRQVGAAVTSKAGELLSIGWNDVPISGGGLYGKPPLCSTIEGKWPDERCYAKSGMSCHNDQEKRVIAEKIVESLVAAETISAANQSKAMQTILSDSRVKDLIEFSRAVHAEMHAILGASRVAGDRILGGRIFVTTYPCHACARHIVAAGITEVFYIEPYRKSLAIRLHSDAMTEALDSTGRVRLMQFDGVAPRRFIDLFDAGSRKSGSGVLDLKGREDATPSTYVSLRAIPRLEEVVVAEISSKSLRLPELTTVGVKNDQDKT
ncbi:MAG: anti-phage dCTP deaminase [Sterolibacterium sp.]